MRKEGIKKFLFHFSGKTHVMGTPHITLGRDENGHKKSTHAFRGEMTMRSFGPEP